METSVSIPSESTIIAVKLSEEACAKFEPYTDDTVKDLGLHLTIANLGAVKDEDVSRCISALHEVASKLSPIKLSSEGEGYLNLPGGRFALVALANAQGLDVWRYKIATALTGYLNSEIEGFLPHITMAFSDEKKLILPDTFAFKPFPVEKVYFLRGKEMKVPIPIGNRDGHTATERELSAAGDN